MIQIDSEWAYRLLIVKVDHPTTVLPIRYIFHTSLFIFFTFQKNSFSVYGLTALTKKASDPAYLWSSIFSGRYGTNLTIEQLFYEYSEHLINGTMPMPLTD